MSVTLLRGRGARTAAYTGELALSLDEVQYEKGHGPCLQAAVSAETVSVPDMVEASRWPDWAKRAV